MSNWTDSVEKTLETLKQNTRKLSENYLEKYNSFKTKLTYINSPLVILSALNAYAILELDSFSKTIQIASAATSLAVASILGTEMIFGLQTRMENALSKHKDFSSLQSEIEKVITLGRDDRKLDGNDFLMKRFKEYKELVLQDEFIIKFDGNLQENLTEQVEDMQAYLEDHWNILFRPQFRKIKKKNEKVIEAIKSSGQELQKTLEVIVEPIEETIQPVIEVAKEGKEGFSEWLGSLWKKDTNDEKPPSPEKPKDETFVEMHKIYSQPVQKVIIEEKSKKNAFAMNFQEKR